MRWDRYFETLRSQPQCDRQLQQRGFICLLGSWCFKTISKIERVRLYKLRGFIALWICVEMRRAVFWVTMASCDAVLRRCVWFTLYWRWFPLACSLSRQSADLYTLLYPSMFDLYSNLGRPCPEHEWSGSLEGSCFPGHRFIHSCNHYQFRFQ